jgi:signal transduction histidine kinase
MDLRVVWSLVHTGYSFAAIAALAVMAIVWRRTPHGRETAFLCGSMLALALFYGCYAVDATRHANGLTETQPTVWSAFAQTAIVASGTLFVAFLLTIVKRLYFPARPSAWLVWAVVVHVALAGSLALWLAGRLAWALVGGASPDVVNSGVERIVGTSGSLVTTLCFISPLAFFSALFANVPNQQHARWVRWLTEGGVWRSVSPVEAPLSTPRVSSRAIRTFRQTSILFLYGAWLLNTQWIQQLQVETSLSLSVTTLVRLLLLPSLLALVYYHERFLFFDVLIKRGMVAGLVALGVTVTVFEVSAAIGPAIDGAWLAPTCVVATLVFIASASAMQRANQWLDHLVFRRPDYRTELPIITAAMAACPTVESLISLVTARLQDTLASTFVHYGAEVGTQADVVVGLGQRDRPRGHLQLGPRARGQQYGSEDLIFVDAVAAHMTSLLDGFDARESTRLATVAELKALRAQINPHFLFNALTTLAEMAHSQPATERAILNLSRVFRYALDATQHELVPLGEEIDAIRAYLEIEAERFDDRLRFDIAVPADVRRTPVPPMLLQPLVENAVKHGLSSRVGSGMVRVAAEREDGLLRLIVQDDGVGFDLDHTPRRVGLSNVGARVEQTGGWWRVQSIPGAGTQVTLALMMS